MIYYKQVGFTDAEMIEEIKAMQREHMQTRAKADGLRNGVTELIEDFIWDKIKRANIKPGDKCVMRFSTGAEVVVFEDVADGEILVRHIGAKGKPHKLPTNYDYTYIDLFEPNPEQEAT